MLEYVVVTYREFCWMSPELPVMLRRLPRCNLRCFGILRSLKWQFLTDVSGQPIGPIFKFQAVQEDCLSLEDGTDRVLSECRIVQDPAEPPRIPSVTDRSCCLYRTQGSLCLIHNSRMEDCISICSRTSISICSRTSSSRRVEQLSIDSIAACADWRALVMLCLHAHYNSSQWGITWMSELVTWQASTSGNVM